MENNENKTIAFCLLALFLIFLLIFSQLGNHKNTATPYNREKVSVTKISENLYVDDINAGPMNFTSAEVYCKSKGMELPSREDAWEMWRASANCKIAIVTAKNIIKDKQTFMKSCHLMDSECTAHSDSVKYSCNNDADLLFLDDKTFKYGNYWLKDRYDSHGHYTANFISGVSNAYRDDINLIGVRCVSHVSR